MSLNKGELSEVYVFLKLLAEGKLYAADANLNKLSDIYYPILAIIRKEFSQTLTFHRDSTIILQNSTGQTLQEIDIQTFKKYALRLFEYLNNSSLHTNLKESIDFLNHINVTQLKAKSNDKRDITVVVHDIFTGFTPTLGFSIKSQIGSASTLLNASGATNFIYEVVPKLSRQQIESINRIDTKNKLQDRLNAMYSQGVKLKFIKTANETFQSNLAMIDSQFDTMLASILQNFYLKKAQTIQDLTKLLNQQNPCGFNQVNNHPFYEYKMKNFLTDCALGMMPATAWNGIYDANGGYIVVKEDGQLLCYHIYNRNEFQEYLFNNTKLETPSSTKHKFGTIYEENTAQYFNLNLQIRFLK